MMKQVYYCDAWAGNYKEPRGLMTEAQAKAAHLAKKTYTVLIGSETQPNCFLDIGDKFVFVSFLDDKLRKTLGYSFQEVEGGQLF